jgi:hypothetical protein
MFLLATYLVPQHREAVVALVAALGVEVKCHIAQGACKRHVGVANESCCL